MKICIFNHDKGMSGAPSALYDYIKYDKEDEFLLITPKILSDNKFVELKNVEIFEGHYHVPSRSLDKEKLKRTIKRRLVYIYELTLGELLHTPKIKKKIKNFKPDVIITNTFALALGPSIATSLNIPHIWHIREHMESDLHITHFNQKKIRKLTEKSHAIFISKSIQEYYLSRYKFIDYRLIYDQVDIRYEECHDDEYFKNNELHLMIAGGLQDGKGQIDAIKVTELLNNRGYNAHLDIYGKQEGYYYKDLLNYIEKNKVKNVAFKGFSTNLQEIRPNYDIALICSRNEGFGRVTIESMYAKNITIGLDAPATNELIEDGVSGYLYKKDDIEGLFKIIENCYKNKDEVIKITNQARIDAKEYMQPIYKEVIEYCKGILKN